MCCPVYSQNSAMDEGSTLKLIINKGPRKGETLEFRPGSVIRLGRVVRGNTIAIKESGISSKHLSIQFDSGSGHWTILDLDSSNGTIFNGAEVVPLQSAAIKDGDTIKIGELTSISVRIEVGEMCRLRRNPRRRCKGGDSDNVAVGISNLSQCGGGSELGLESGEDLGDNVVEVAPVKRNLPSRPRKRTGSKNEAEEIDREIKQGNDMDVRRTRSSKKKALGGEFNPTLSTVPETLANGTDHREGKSFVGDKGRKNLCNDSIENIQIGGLDELSRQDGCFESMNMDAIHESLPTGSSKVVGVGVREETRVPNEINLGGEYRDGFEMDNVREEVGLEKMTLGEWLDYLEVYLPKQMYEETEVMILKMRQEAAKFHEFRLQQGNANVKGKKPVD